MTASLSRRTVSLAAVILAALAVSCPTPAGAQQPAPGPAHVRLEFRLEEVGSTTAQQPAPGPSCVRRLTLDEAKQLALQNNKNLVLGRLNVAEKQFGITAAKKDYFPKVFGNVTYMHFNDDLGKVITVPRGVFGVLPPGVATASVAVVNQDTTLATVLAAQPITKLILVNAGVQIARADANAAQAQLDKGTRDILSGVAQAYHGLVGALRIQNALELQIKLLEQVLQAKPIPQLRIALVEAKQGLALVRGQVLELTGLINDLCDLPARTALEVVDPMPQELPVRCADEAAQLALTNSPQIREAEQSIAKAQAALQAARMEYLPDVNVLGGYTNQSAANYIQPNIAFVGVTASYTFLDWGKRGDVRRQRNALIALAQQNLRVTMDKVQQEARKAYGAFEQAREAYKLAGEMVQARREAEKVAAGMAALEAKGETAKAELEYMKAEIAYRVAHAQLAAVIGREMCEQTVEVRANVPASRHVGR